MRRLLVSIAALLSMLLSLGSAAPAYQPARDVLVFGPSIHLIDPSRYPASDPQYPGQPLPDAEPSIAIAADGTVWVAAMHMQHGTALWRGRVGLTSPTFVGMPDHGIGGNDVTVAVGAGATPTLYTASLVPITAPVTAWRIATTACPAALVAPGFGACAFHPHAVYGLRDRPWLASYGHSTAYLAYLTRSENVLSGHMSVQRSDDAGRSWRPVGEPLAPLAASPLPLHGWPSPLAIDPRDGTVYEAFVTDTPAAPSDHLFNRVVVAASRDDGVTWRDVTVYQGPTGTDTGNMWPALAVDAGGRIYVAWSTRRHIMLASSADGGATWSPPAPVDAPVGGLRTSVLPWVAAGAAGSVALAWYGTTAASNLAPDAHWRVMFAASHDGGRTFAQAAATGTIHQGPVCSKGDICPWPQRQLLDDFGLALDPRTGRATIAYSRSIEFGDYRACRRAANCPQTYYVEELAE